MFYINSNMVYILKYRRSELVLVGITYYMPDYTNILQTFHWQTEDVTPDLPRVHQFLNYWKDNIEARIKDVSISYSGKNKVRIADFYEGL